MSSSTSKRTWRIDLLANGDPLQDTLDGIINDAYEMIDHPTRDKPGRPEEGEIIEDQKHFTFLLEVSGRRSEGLSVLLRKGALEIQGPGLALLRRIPSDADPTTFERSFRNGVLSLRINKL